ncbi:hypothetical protein GIB67_024563 [Kingdonia uniflora]|uniref:Pentatricopeptide repeat-containing protein n=1 Tax=Kingdonia uniflora TaxID=39325 RepID=A0A7J7LNV2_9MAGN|nr:hypothetical protein GIB67_024563 [Kingdonia uniflora]
MYGKETWSFEEVTSTLLSKERRLKGSESSLGCGQSSHYRSDCKAGKGKGTSSTKDSECDNNRLATVTRDDSDESLLVVAADGSPQDRGWVFDSGATLHVCTQGMVQQICKVFELLREQLWYRPNPGIYIKLIVMLGKCKQSEKAQSLFDSMIEEGLTINLEMYTALLSAYSRSGLIDHAFSLLNQMKNTTGCLPDVFTYSILIKSCLQIFAFSEVQKLLSDMTAQGIKPNTVTYNTLIDAYGKAGRFELMESTLIEMLHEQQCEPDVWTMNSTLRAFGGSGQIETMEKCYEKFKSAGINPNIKTFNILLGSYAKTGNYEKMSAVMEYMQKYYFSWTIVTYNVVIDAFGRAGNLKQMEYLFRLMRSERIKPNCITLCSLVSAYGRAGSAEKIGGVLRFIENSDVMLDTAFFNCLVDAYGRVGRLVEMKGVLEMMEKRGCKPDKVTYTTMIKGYSANGITGRSRELQDIISRREKIRSHAKGLQGKMEVTDRSRWLWVKSDVDNTSKYWVIREHHLKQEMEVLHGKAEERHRRLALLEDIIRKNSKHHFVKKKMPEFSVKIMEICKEREEIQCALASTKFRLLNEQENIMGRFEELLEKFESGLRLKQEFIRMIEDINKPLAQEIAVTCELFKKRIELLKDYLHVYREKLGYK